MEELKGAYKKFSTFSLAYKIICLLVSAAIIIYFVSASVKGGDFASYLEAAAKMVKGTNIYDPPYIHLRYSYSPFWAMVLMPLALIPSSVAVFLWLVINVFLLWRTITLLRDYFDIKFDEPWFDFTLWFLIILFMSRFIELNFHHAQMTIFLLWSMLESIRWVNSDKEITGGIVIGLCTIIKIMPVVMIPYFIYRAKYRAALASIIAIVAAFFLPILVVGKEMFFELNKTWLQILRPDSSEFQIDIIWFLPHNLSTLLYRVLMKTDAPYIKNILSLDYDTATRCIWVIIALLILLTIYFLATYPFREVRSKGHILYEISYIALLIPLIFPHQMKYAFYFLLPAICCLMKYIISAYQAHNTGGRFLLIFALVIGSFVLCTMTTDLLLGMDYSIVTQYLKTITIGTLLLIPALMLTKKYFVD